MELSEAKYLKQRIKANLMNSKISHIVKNATNHTLSKRKEIISLYYPHWEHLRDKAYQIRKTALENWDFYFEMLQKNLKEKGIDVFYADNSETACKTVKNILDIYKARLIVKSKSMVTEEINLNEYLGMFGYEVIETDLGEFIIQLAGERPSHITAPALHKSRQEVGQLFYEKFNIDYTDAPEKLTEFARRNLREKFFLADAGISGANFLIADSGTIVLVENEGNARFTTTLPKLHIILTSIEKIVPTLSDALTLLKLLPVSATGQKITSYVSFINRSTTSDAKEGPVKIVVILVDNGRSKLIKESVSQRILFCIKCGACMNTCPIYQEIGGHTYGTVYPGPIGSIFTPWMSSFKDFKDLAFASSLCGACSEICPVKVDIHYQLLRIRKLSVEKKYSKFIERIIFHIWSMTMNNFKLYATLTKILGFISPLFEESGTKIPIWSKHKYFPPPALESFHQLWKKEINKYNS